MALEVVLEQQGGTTPRNLDDLKTLATEMARYYYKGFGMTMQGILCNAELFLKRTDEVHLADEAYEWLEKIERFYAQIPFETLQGREEFYPLFVVRRLLPELRQGMGDVFKEKMNGSLRDLETDARTIVNVGRLYWDSLTELLKKIGSFPEGKDFRVAIPDQIKDHTWYF